MRPVRGLPPADPLPPGIRRRSTPSKRWTFRSAALTSAVRAAREKRMWTGSATSPRSGNENQNRSASGSGAQLARESRDRHGSLPASAARPPTSRPPGARRRGADRTRTGPRGSLPSRRLLPNSSALPQSQSPTRLLMRASLGGGYEAGVKEPARRRSGHNPRVTGLPDYHVHTFRCGHAGGASRDFVLAAIERGLSEIAFTDHIPLYFLPEAQRDPRLAMREDQFDGYVREVEELRDEFAGRIAVRLGLEADYAEGREEDLARWLVAGPLGPRARLGPLGRRRLDRRSRAIPGPLRARRGRVPLRGVLPPAGARGRDRALRRSDPLRPAEEARAPTRDTEDRRRERGRRGRGRGGLRRGNLVGGPAQARRGGVPGGAVCSRRIVAAGIPVTFSSDAHAPAEVGWGYDRTLPLARACGVVEFVTLRSSTEGSPPAPDVRCAPSRVKRSAEGLRRRPSVA